MTATKTLTLTVTDWDTIRTAILCHSIDSRHGGQIRVDKDWAADCFAAYLKIKEAMKEV